MPDVLFIEFCNFEDFPVRGQLSFAKQMVHAFGSRLALVGVSTDETPVGRWIKRIFDGKVCDFFSIGRWIESAQKRVIPARIRAYWGITRYRKQILSIHTRAVFISSREALLAAYRWGWSSLCFLCSGLESPLRMPRYKWAAFLAGAYDSSLMPALQSVDLLLAAADESAIQAFAAKTNGRIQKEKIISFPTRVDTATSRSLGMTARGLLKGAGVQSTTSPVNLTQSRRWRALSTGSSMT